MNSERYLWSIELIYYRNSNNSVFGNINKKIYSKIDLKASPYNIIFYFYVLQQL